MRADAFRCDLCGDSYKPEYGRTVSVLLGREKDASGNGYTDKTREVDCCQGCVALALIDYIPLRKFVWPCEQSL